MRRRRDVRACATSRANPTPACSAATPTGAARSGSRSTTCSSSRCRSSTTTTATTSGSSARPAPGSLLTLERGRRRADAAADAPLPRAMPTAAAPVFGSTSALAGRPALPRLRPVPRVLPRRHRPRPRRVAPDRLDRPGREAAAAAPATALRPAMTASPSGNGSKPMDAAATRRAPWPASARAAITPCCSPRRRRQAGGSCSSTALMPGSSSQAAGRHALTSQRYAPDVDRSPMARAAS